MRSRVTAALVGLLLFAATLARASMPWSNEAAVGVRVNGHSFHDVHVEGDGCRLRVRLLFEAPAAGYSDPKNVTRNHHSFKARLKLASGHSVDSKTFGNSAAGERAYSFEEDTTAAACWAKEPSKVVKLEVIGCRGPACDLGSFDD